MAKKTSKTKSKNPVGPKATAEAAPKKKKRKAKVRSKKKAKGTPRARRGTTKKAANKGRSESPGPEVTPVPAPLQETAAPATTSTSEVEIEKAPEATTPLVQTTEEPVVVEAAVEAIVEDEPVVGAAAVVEPEVAAEAAAARDEDSDTAEHEIVEMSAEEAMAFLSSCGIETKTTVDEDGVEMAEFVADIDVPKMVSARLPRATRGSSRRSKPRRPFRGALDSDWRVLTFESAHVEADMRVGGSTLARLYGMVRDESLDADLGPICQTVQQFVTEWDKLPIGVNALIVANLSEASSFLESLVVQRPDVSESFWVVYETLRSDVSTVKNVFLAGLRARNQARAIGFGPRNVVEAARRGAEAVRGHIEWGFGRHKVA